jgi:hypothetical protein
MTENTISVLELEDLALDIAALLDGADDVDGIRIHEAGIDKKTGDIRVVLVDADQNGRAVYLQVMSA